jgi:hypothetical protein
VSKDLNSLSWWGLLGGEREIQLTAVATQYPAIERLADAGEEADGDYMGIIWGL